MPQNDDPALFDSHKPHEPVDGLRAFRVAVLRGLGVVAPPLLTLVILLWIVRTIDYYVLDPIVVGVRNVMASALSDVHTELPGAVPSEFDATVLTQRDESFKRLPSGEYIPLDVYRRVERSSGVSPTTAKQAYRRWVEVTFLQPWIVVPIFIVVFVAVMFVVGNLVAVRLGRAFWSWFEHGIGQLPIVRSVYSSTKQVTDYMFSERELDFTRVVAVEYPGRGIWSLAFVTSEGIADVQRVAGEPMVAIMVPTSPFPITGYTMLVPRSEVLDVNLTVEEAIEYLVSCGVVVPLAQLEMRPEGKPG